MDITYYRYQSYQRIESQDHLTTWQYVTVAPQGEDLYIGDMKSDKNGTLMEIPYTSFGDYNGSTCERSNYEVFMEKYGKLAGVWPVHGGYYSHFVVIDRKLYDDRISERKKPAQNDRQYDEYDDMIEDIESLDRYPLIDEEHMSNLEYTMECEDWNSYGRKDLQAALTKAELYDDDSMPDDKTLDEMFIQACDSANQYPIHEDAVSTYWDIDAVVEKWPRENASNDAQGENNAS